MSVSDPPVEFGPGVRAADAARVYARLGRVHVADVLSEASARRACESLTTEVEWQLHFNDGERVYDLSAAQVAALPEANRTALLEAIHRKAQTGFQYLFDNCPLSDLHALRQHTGWYAMRIFEFLNSTRFLDYARKLTGVRSIALADAQATRYRSGHFLTCHDDQVGGRNRVAAYVLNLTPAWRADLGGILNFIARDGHVAEGYVPCFNALNVFRVPQKHAVSCVAPFAPASGRLSISGWLREA